VVPAVAAVTYPTTPPAAVGVERDVVAMAILSSYARGRKLDYFLGGLDRGARILDVGCADGWVGQYARDNGFANYVGLDILPSANADVVGDVNRWRELGLNESEFDVITAFEIIEHGDFAESLNSLLKPGGRLFVTTPVPHMDWLCKIFERVGLNQKRTSPHTHLIDLAEVPHLRLIDRQTKGYMSQWGVFTKGEALVEAQIGAMTATGSDPSQTYDQEVT
jgi:2-polyprenyl-3-methyl-5-hydroxy-6-metoxy-1,4-benzoquinol methylase